MRSSRADRRKRQLGVGAVSRPEPPRLIVSKVLNVIVLMGVVLAVAGKLVGIAFAARSQNATRVPFIVLVASGYAMVIGGGLAGGSVSF
jgi:hypothetical protein